MASPQGALGQGAFQMARGQTLCDDFTFKMRSIGLALAAKSKLVGELFQGASNLHVQDCIHNRRSAASFQALA